MKEISLTQGFVALVDDADFESVNAFNWYAHRVSRRIYAVRKVRRANGTQADIMLHSFLLPSYSRVDHKDGDGLNNQRENLRPASAQQNLRGFQRKAVGKSSPFRGVSWDKANRRWRASIKFGKKVTNLGNFKLEKDAALAYDKAARDFFGEFASPNFPTIKSGINKQQTKV